MDRQTAEIRRICRENIETEDVYYLRIKPIGYTHSYVDVSWNSVSSEYVAAHVILYGSDSWELQDKVVSQEEYEKIKAILKEEYEIKSMQGFLINKEMSPAMKDLFSPTVLTETKSRYEKL